MPTCPECGEENPELGAKCSQCADSYYVYDDAADLGDTDPYIGHKAAEKYVVVSKISEGGMGAVYRALQLPVEREVALKVLLTELEDNDEVRDRFIREARAISKINHPNIITLHDFGFDASDYPYMVMEYAPGEGLDDWLYRDDLTLDRILHVVHQMLSALADAHEQGIVHRDLKPENIMVTGTGTDEDFIKILDFGIARLVNEQATEGLTREGEVFGTPHYMSPEQAEGETGIGPEADVYASGIMLYELLCAKCPFDAQKPLSILYKQINEELPPLQPRDGVQVPPEVEELLRKATQKDPDDRFSDAGAMLEALEAIDDSSRSQSFATSKNTLNGLGSDQSTTPNDIEEQQDPSRDEMATANTLGFDDEEAEEAASHSDVSPLLADDSDAPKRTESLEADPIVEEADRERQRRTLLLIAGGAILLGGLVAGAVMLSGDPANKSAKKPTAAISDDVATASGEATSSTRHAAGKPDVGADREPTAARASADASKTAPDGGEARAGRAPSHDSDSDESSPTGASKSTGSGRPAEPTEERAAQPEEESGPETTDGSGSETEVESKTESAEEPETAGSSTGSDATPQESPEDRAESASDSPDPDETETTEQQPADDETTDEDQGELEKFGAPKKSEDDSESESSNEPTKFGSPDE